MHILIGLAMGLALLYFWLIGHWFARVIVFLILACVGFAAGASIVNFGLYDGHANILGPGLLAGAVGAALAWPLASIPTYYWRHHLRALG
jgi:hypothetical protein